MKRRHLLPLLIVLAGIAISLTLLLCPRQLPEEACSDIYRQYCHTPGIKAAYIKDYPLDDSTTIAVTMLQAQDTNIWNNTVMKLFHIDDSNDYIPRQLTFRLIPKNADSLQKSENLLDNDLIAGDKRELTIGIFHLENEKQYDAIFETYFNKLKK